MKRLPLVALLLLAAAGLGCGASSSSNSADAGVDTLADNAVDAPADTGSGSGAETDTGTPSDTGSGSGSAVDSGSGSGSGGTDDTTADTGAGSGDTSPPIPEQLLFVGNSYTYYNDLDQLVATFATSLPGAPVVTASRVAVGGYRLPQHEADAATAGSPLSAFLGAGTGGYPAWTYVILQDQSQIPGFPETQQERIDSVAASVALAARATAHQATTLLYQTWGRRDGDSTNPDRFPDFLTMNNLLAEGYAQMEQAIRAAGYNVRRVPVGAAFAAIHEGDLAAGKDPLDPTSLFYRLYASDGSHPSLEGSYLAAVTFVCTLRDTAAPPFAFSPAALGAADVARLQTAGCDAARSLASGPNP